MPHRRQRPTRLPRAGSLRRPRSAMDSRLQECTEPFWPRHCDSPCDRPSRSRIGQTRRQGDDCTTRSHREHPSPPPSRALAGVQPCRSHRAPNCPQPRATVDPRCPRTRLRHARPGDADRSRTAQERARRVSCHEAPGLGDTHMADRRCADDRQHPRCRGRRPTRSRRARGPRAHTRGNTPRRMGSAAAVCVSCCPPKRPIPWIEMKSPAQSVFPRHTGVRHGHSLRSPRSLGFPWPDSR